MRSRYLQDVEGGGDVAAAGVGGEQAGVHEAVRHDPVADVYTRSVRACVCVERQEGEIERERASEGASEGARRARGKERGKEGARERGSEGAGEGAGEGRRVRERGSGGAGEG